jgi:cbb3-type cytochrome c oxidase subunit III
VVFDIMVARQFISGCAGLILALCACQANAQSDEARIQQVRSNPEALAKAVAEGKKAAFFCANCHGDNGNSDYDYIPTLAGQHPLYLLNQIRKFADGRRQDDFMSGMIKLMKDEDRFNIALFYSAQPVSASLVKDSALTARGKQIFGNICMGCHGVNGYGNQNIARLAGQHPVYLRQSLEKYRKGTKERSDPVMGSIARRLSSDDINAVAAYISTMK